jgi:hypothetical protein
LFHPAYFRSQSMERALFFAAKRTCFLLGWKSQGTRGPVLFPLQGPRQALRCAGGGGRTQQSTPKKGKFGLHKPRPSPPSPSPVTSCSTTAITPRPRPLALPAEDLSANARATGEVLPVEQSSNNDKGEWKTLFKSLQN